VPIAVILEFMDVTPPLGIAASGELRRSVATHALDVPGMADGASKRHAANAYEGIPRIVQQRPFVGKQKTPLYEKRKLFAPGFREGVTQSQSVRKVPDIGITKCNGEGPTDNLSHSTPPTSELVSYQRASRL